VANDTWYILRYNGNAMKIRDLFDIKLLRFILVGFINTITGSAIMFLLYNLASFSYWTSSAFSYVITSVMSFFLNKYFTFRVRDWSFNMVISFFLTIAVSYFLAFGISRPVINILLANSSVTVRENIALFTGMCVFTGINYLGQRLFVFKDQPDKND